MTVMFVLGDGGDGNDEVLVILSLYQLRKKQLSLDGVLVLYATHPEKLVGEIINRISFLLCLAGFPYGRSVDVLRWGSLYAYLSSDMYTCRT